MELRARARILFAGARVDCVALVQVIPSVLLSRRDDRTGHKEQGSAGPVLAMPLDPRAISQVLRSIRAVIAISAWRWRERAIVSGRCQSDHGRSPRTSTQ